MKRQPKYQIRVEGCLLPCLILIALWIGTAAAIALAIHLCR